MRFSRGCFSRYGAHNQASDNDIFIYSVHRSATYNIMNYVYKMSEIIIIWLEYRLCIGRYKKKKKQIEFTLEKPIKSFRMQIKFARAYVQCNTVATFCILISDFIIIFHTRFLWLVFFVFIMIYAYFFTSLSGRNAFLMISIMCIYCHENKTFCSLLCSLKKRQRLDFDRFFIWDIGFKGSVR